MTDPKKLANPYLPDTRVTVSALLPCSQQAAWELIGTPAGYVRWFPTTCDGPFERGGVVEKGWWWPDSGSTRHTIVELRPPSSITYEWEVVDGAVVQYEVQGDSPTTVTIRADYPDTEDGRAAQLLDVAPWTFAILNLKSIASGGVDLRHHGSRPRTGSPLID